MDNKVGEDIEAVSLLWLFEGLSHLTTLDLGLSSQKWIYPFLIMIRYVKTGDSGACFIGEGLKVNSTFTSLNLRVKNKKGHDEVNEYGNAF